MNMKRNLLGMAVLATMGVASPASAGFLSETGTGQVLIFPYYTVQNGFDTYIQIVNTTASPKAVKVRFREAKNSAEVLDFNLYLSPWDVWAGAITQDGSEGAKIVTKDTSCTAPAIGAAGEPFRNLYYTGQAADVSSIDDDGENDLSRVREGYVEVIEMGVPQHVVIGVSGNTAYFDTAIKHTGTGASRKPGNCSAIVESWVPGTGPDGVASIFEAMGSVSFPSLPTEISAPIGGLYGQAHLINVSAGTDYTYDPVVIESWAGSDPNGVGLGDSVGNTLHAFPGDLNPSLGDGTNVSHVIVNNGGVPATASTTWGSSLPWGNAGGGQQAVTALLMHSALMNSFSVESDLAAGTDWVVTFPNKAAYVDDTTADLPFNVFDPFGNGNAINGDADGACQFTSLTVTDREEQRPVGGIDFSPKPRGGSFALCWEANVITFDQSNVLGSVKVNHNIDTPYQSGWTKLGWSPMTNTSSWTAAMLASANAVAFADGGLPYPVNYQQNIQVNGSGPLWQGLPAIGFAVTEFVNGSNGTVLSNYGGSNIHKYERTQAVMCTPDQTTCLVPTPPQAP